MENNMNINRMENIEEVTVDKIEEKVTSAKMFQSTKDIIDTFSLEGNQQEKLDALVKEYKRFLEEAEGIAKVEVTGLDLSEEFKLFSKEIDVFTKSMEQKVNKHISDTVQVNISNIEKDFKVMHNEFIKCLEETKATALVSETELEGNRQKITELNVKVTELNNVVGKLEYENKELTSKNVKLDKECTRLRSKNEDLLDSVASYNSKYESEKSVKNAQVENNNILKNEIRDLKENIKSYKLEIADSNELLKSISTKKSNLEVENEKLEKRNESLENDLKELNFIKAKNIELEGTIKALEGQSKLLETTLNTINTTISSITDAKVIAEERATSLELENRKLLKEIEELKKQSEIKK